MKVVFVSYANEAMAYSLKRIGRQARGLGVFDDVLLYTPADVPDYVRESPLFSAARGAGYWCWKPAIIEDALERYEEGTVVVYCDAGCTLRKSPLWQEYLSYMKNYDTLCFQYAESQPQWKKWGADSSRIKYWTKKKTLDYLSVLTRNNDAGEFCQIWAGCVFFKSRENKLLESWKDLIVSHPELVKDPSAEEMQDQYPGFAGHRHDQSILTVLAMTEPGVIILPEVSEQYTPDAPVWASRIRARNLREYIWVQARHYLRIWLGDSRWERFKTHISK